MILCTKKIKSSFILIVSQDYLTEISILMAPNTLGFRSDSEQLMKNLFSKGLLYLHK